MSAEVWNRAAQAGLCQTLADLGSGLARAGAWAIVGGAATGGGGAAAGLAALGGAAAANLVYGYGCTNDPNAPPDGGINEPNFGCTEVSGCGWLEISANGVDYIWGAPNYPAKKITGAYQATLPGDASGLKYWFISWIDCDDTLKQSNTGFTDPGFSARLVPLDGEQCIDGDPPFGDPGPYPIKRVTDVETNCQVDVQVLGWVNEGNERAGAAISVKAVEGSEPLISPVKPTPAGLLNDSSSSGDSGDDNGGNSGRNDNGGGGGGNAGGIIGGCNFDNTIVYLGPGGGGGGNDGPINFPDPGPENDDDGIPTWLKTLTDVLTGAAGAALANALDDFFATTYPEDVYRLVSVCETNQSGEPVSRAVESVIPPAKQFDAVIARLDALVPLLQGQKDFKQPICREKVERKGDLRTISFVSDEKSPSGDGRLRKRLRYRSESGVGLSGLVDHWRDFTWDAGPVCVQHRGHSWGSPQVWAASPAEGKRVILHAAAEAGIDPNQVGEWTVSGSDNPRYGMPGTMRVCTKGGYYWITERLGSNGRPMVAST